MSQDVQDGNGGVVALWLRVPLGEGDEAEGHVRARALAELGLRVPVCIYVGSSCYFHRRDWGRRGRNVLLVRSFP